VNKEGTNFDEGEFTKVRNKRNGNNTVEGGGRYNNNANAQTRGGRPPMTVRKEHNVEYLNKQKNDGNGLKRSMNGKEVVDEFFADMRQPSLNDTEMCTQDMLKYFKGNWEKNMLEKGKENGCNETEDVLEYENDVA
ncbi:hypothetical protein Tco_0669382, partial [Tanacetum coccineum]